MQNLFGEEVKETVIGPDRPHAAAALRGRDPAPFSLTDHIFVTDRRRAWMCYHELLRDGYTPDADLLPAIWWCLKSGLQVHAGDTGDVKPFVLKKATQMYKSWGPAMMHEKSLQFLELVIDARSDNGLPIEYGLERWLLTLPQV